MNHAKSFVLSSTYAASALATALLLLLPAPASAQPERSAGTVSVAARIRPAEFTGDLRNLPQNMTPEERQNIHRPFELEGPRPTSLQTLPGVPRVPAEGLIPDPTLSVPMPAPGMSFNGMDYNTNGAGFPPDTVGDVGPNHYVLAVNTSVGIYNKSTGAALTTFTFNSLWSGAGTGTPCDTANNGDPTVIWDPQHDRFIIADFAWTNIQNGPYYECIAVSKTSDPVSGGWWLYAIRTDDASHAWLADYPKMGIWPDGLYMTANMFDCLNSNCSSALYKEVRVWALDISKMVNGLTTTVLVVDTNNSSDYFTFLPSNYRGAAPPAGRPNFVAAQSVIFYAWYVFKFHADYVTPANSTFIGPISVSEPAGYSVGATIVPEPAPGNNLDTLRFRTMMQNQYRNLNGVESIWLNHTVGTAGGSTTPTGIHWAQIDVSGGTVSTTAVQQQIFNNGADGLNRFMGALAVDHFGNMAVGYSVVNASTAPDIRYAGRKAGDPLSTLPQTEVSMLGGTSRSVQVGNCGGFPCERWGDYSAMTVDPVDDCTFWYANQYIPVQGLNWTTRIGSFVFPDCPNGPLFIDGFESGNTTAWSSAVP